MGNASRPAGRAPERCVSPRGRRTLPCLPRRRPARIVRSRAALSKTVLPDDWLRTFRIPVKLSDADVRAVRRVLNAKAFTALVRRAVTVELNKRPALTPVRAAVTRCPHPHPHPGRGPTRAEGGRFFRRQRRSGVSSRPPDTQPSGGRGGLPVWRLGVRVRSVTAAGRVTEREEARRQRRPDRPLTALDRLDLLVVDEPPGGELHPHRTHPPRWNGPTATGRPRSRRVRSPGREDRVAEWREGDQSPPRMTADEFAACRRPSACGNSAPR